jgi:TorA maturation chaperone TorD
VRRLTHGVAFLDEHLCRWFPEFSARVAAQDARGFYALAVEAAQAFIIHDLDLTRALLARHREVARA